MKSYAQRTYKRLKEDCGRICKTKLLSTL